LCWSFWDPWRRDARAYNFLIICALMAAKGKRTIKVASHKPFLTIFIKGYYTHTH
jgi:hypothetical protein